ncbi:MAG: putative MxaL protein [Hydrocarboniphaga sp.]|uniref:vWA domain-containing protein n=1 Tax=Hydrocarboniphaga sp. TaxID=2033016 RepID=UPI00261384B6|nr:vWA domain-containing protein [Hydrocarboniphaga sp.]MDB5969205.1 putative MxaL protein [Hydrocarboniphaga sp.]
MKGAHRLSWPRPSLLLLLLAMLVLLPVYAAPSRLAPGISYAYLFVIDVSQSMNVRDQAVDASRGAALVSRLEAAKLAVDSGLRGLPCGSRASVALFADDETLVLFEPLEICAHYPAMQRVVADISWRMAWAGNSRIDTGIVSAMTEAASRSLKLVFFTDGDQAPYREQVRLNELQAHRGATRGLIVGVGGEQERPIPKLGVHDEIIGWWQPQDAARNGFNPNMAIVMDGFEPAARGTDTASQGPHEHLSALRSEPLQQFAQAAELNYLRLGRNDAYTRALADPHLANFDVAPRDLRMIFGLIAASLMLLAWVLPDRP